MRGRGRAAERRGADRVRRAAGHRAGPRAEYAGRAGGGRRAPPPDNGDDGAKALPPETVGAPGAMYVGNLERYQGIDLLLEGFRHTLNQMEEARLVIVGGPKDDIERSATELPLSASVRRSTSWDPNPCPSSPISCARRTCWSRLASRAPIRR